MPADKTGKAIWTCNHAGNCDFDCLIAGHCAAGMVGKVGKVKVVATASAKLAGYTRHEQ